MILLDGARSRSTSSLAIADDVARRRARAGRRGARRRLARRRRSPWPPATTPVYGINTGFGALAETAIPRDALGALQLNLLRSHAAGVGEPLPARAVRAIDGAARQRARQGLLRHPARDARAPDRAAQPPRAPARAEPRLGRRQRRPRAARAPGAGADRRRRRRPSATSRGRGRRARRARAPPGSTPVTLAAKEGLALINGTQPSTAVAALAARRRRAARPRRRHRRGAVDRCAARIDPPVRRAHPCRAAARRPARRRPPTSCALLAGQRHQQVARALRPRPGRLLAALRGAGPRRGARRARVRAPDADDRGQRRDRQPDGLRRRRRDRLGRQLSRRAGRDCRRPPGRSRSRSSRRSASGGRIAWSIRRSATCRRS